MTVTETAAADEQAVHPDTVRVWRVVALIWAAALALNGLFLLGWLGLGLGNPWPGLLLLLLWALLVTGAVMLAWHLPPLYYEHLRYRLDEHGLHIRSGIWWRSQLALPRIRIQHTDVTQGPLQRRYGLATLTLYTAGTEHNKIVLPGLALEIARALRAELLPREDHDAV